MGGAGTVIDVIKANKIIPKVIHVTKTEGAFEIPKHCPVCGAETVIRISENSGTKTLRCTNQSCPAKQLKKYTRFVSKPGMDIDGISEQTLSRFINEGWIHNYGDIYRLRNHLDEIAQLEGFGEKSAANLSASLEKSKTADDTKLLFALNIPLVGPDVAKRLLRAYSLEELVQKALSDEDPEMFSVIDGIGPEKSAALVTCFRDPENLAK